MADNCSNESLDVWRDCLRQLFVQQTFHVHEAVLITSAYVLFILLGLLGNGLVIFVVVTKREMRTTRNVFLVNLAVANFILSLIWLPFLWLPTMQGAFPYGALACKLANSLPGMNIYCSTLTILVIAIERYFTVSRIRMGPTGMKILPVRIFWSLN